nr:immunoglobulin heavy chain junction region [Mus musculus]MBK4185988.1 immunoglobulin heavy chain junction region [Mus musculus]MBK4185989.1 immunoglobulin heavy chain junction region [Mus musculus]MBK4195329.1 immunoglobulin heavy chain junction region [Mus musculus]
CARRNWDYFDYW